MKKKICAWCKKEFMLLSYSNRTICDECVKGTGWSPRKQI